MFNPTAWVVIAAALLLMTSSRRLPDASRAVGRSFRILRGELRGLSENDVRVKASAQRGRGALGVPSRHDEAPGAAALAVGDDEREQR